MVLAAVLKLADRARDDARELGVHRDEGVLVHDAADDVHLLVQVVAPYLAHAQRLAALRLGGQALHDLRGAARRGASSSGALPLARGAPLRGPGPVRMCRLCGIHPRTALHFI